MKQPNLNQLEEIVARIEKLEKKKKRKDIWEIIGVLSSLLIPISIFFAGYFLSEADKQSKIEAAKKEIQLAEIKSKVDQAQLVSSFLEALVDTNSYKRKLAIKSILLALPEKGAEIVEVTIVNDPNDAVKNFAEQSLSDSKRLVRKQLIQEIFSPQKQVRLSATEKLLTHSMEDESLISELIDFAMHRFGEETHNMSGIINTIVVLNKMDSDLIQINKKQIISFIERAESLENRKQTQTYLKILKNRIK